MFFSKQKTILGVDIGTSDIKIAQITHGSVNTLDTYGLVNLSYHIDTKSSDQAISETAKILKELVTQARVTTKKCVISLPNSAVFTSVIEMPKMSDKELNSAMDYEAKKYVPLPFSEVAMSWSIVSTNPANNSVNVLLTAVPKLVRESYIKVFELAGLELEIIEIEALALIRALVADPSLNSVIIDIGAKTTGLNFVKQGFLHLTRNLNVGGDTVTDRIAETLHISAVRAEQFKKDFGVAESSFIPEAIKPILAVVKNEVKQLLTIYQSHGVTVNNLILAGGGANIPGITQFFQDLGPKVELGSPLKKVGYPVAAEPVLKRFQLHLPIAIGLALREN